MAATGMPGAAKLAAWPSKRRTSTAKSLESAAMPRRWRCSCSGATSGRAASSRRSGIAGLSSGGRRRAFIAIAARGSRGLRRRDRGLLAWLSTRRVPRGDPGSPTRCSSCRRSPRDAGSSWSCARRRCCRAPAGAFDATVSRVLAATSAQPDASGPPPVSGAISRSACASPRRSFTDASSIAERHRVC